MTTIREYQGGDYRAIAEIFTRAVHEIACEVYTAEQCLAWSAREPNYGHWKKRCAGKRPFVSIIDAVISAFLELDADGHIDCAYTHPTFKRRGVMSQLVRHAVAKCTSDGKERVFTEASICIRPLFEKLGFQTIAEHLVNIRGVKLLNYRMELPLRAA